MSSGFDRLGANARNEGAPRAHHIPSAVDATLLDPATMNDPVTEVVHTRIIPGTETREIVRMQGFTGDTCSNCQGIHMQIAGHCMVCADCGTTTGCS